MQITFKPTETEEGIETLNTLLAMLYHLGRMDIITSDVIDAMNVPNADKPDLIQFEDELKGFDVEFRYFKKTGKISLKSKKIK